MSGRRWTARELKHLQFNWGSHPIEDLAKALNRSIVSIQCKAKDLKLGSPNKGFYTMKQLIRDTGYSETQLRTAMERISLTRIPRQLPSDARQLKKGTRATHYRIDEDVRLEVIDYLRMLPDGGRLASNRNPLKTVNGQWGVGKKPERCHRCKTSERPHLARGYCGSCYNYLQAKGEFRNGTEPRKAAGGVSGASPDSQSAKGGTPEGAPRQNPSTDGDSQGLRRA